MELRGPLADHAAEIEESLAAFSRKVDAAKLLVAVLGPGENDHIGYAKRRQILDTLNAVPGVTAFFPEEADDLTSQLRERYLVPEDEIDRIEWLQFTVANVVLALESSAGAQQEVAVYSRDPNIAPKIVSLMPERFKATAGTSYPGHLRRDLTKEYYSDSEFRECSVATSIAPRMIMQFKLEKVRFQS